MRDAEDLTFTPKPAMPVKAGARGTRRHNSALVLQCIREGSERTRADIARATDLTKFTVSSLVSDLVKLGIVRECGIDDVRRPGKPATLLELDPSTRRIIAVDLSAHGVLVGVVAALAGETFRRIELPVGQLQGEELIDQVVALVDELRAIAGDGLIGIAVGTPGKVTASGLVEGADRLGWRNVELGRILSEGGVEPVHVGNDADFAALAEKEARGPLGDLLVLYLARGIGARVILDGRIIGGGGEIAHISVAPDQPVCTCGKRGCRETLVSATVLTSRIAAAPERREEILREAGDLIGTALSVSVGLLDLPEIVVHGPEELVAEPLLSAIAETVNRRTHTVYRNDLVVTPGAPGTDLVLQGAILRVWRGILSGLVPDA